MASHEAFHDQTCTRSRFLKRRYDASGPALHPPCIHHLPRGSLHPRLVLLLVCLLSFIINYVLLPLLLCITTIIVVIHIIIDIMDITTMTNDSTFTPSCRRPPVAGDPES